MPKIYRKDAARFAFGPPSVHLGLLGLALLVLGLMVWRVELLAVGWPLAGYLRPACWTLLAVGALVLAAAGALYAALPDHVRIRHMVRRALYCPAYGNPLHLQDGELLPKITCHPAENGNGYALTVKVQSCTIEAIKALASFISSSLRPASRRAVCPLCSGLLCPPGFCSARPCRRLSCSGARTSWRRCWSVLLAPVRRGSLVPMAFTMTSALSGSRNWTFRPTVNWAVCSGTTRLPAPLRRAERRSSGDKVPKTLKVLGDRGCRLVMPRSPRKCQSAKQVKKPHKISTKGAVTMAPDKPMDKE